MGSRNSKESEPLEILNLIVIEKLKILVRVSIYGLIGLNHAAYLKKVNRRTIWFELCFLFGENLE